MMKKLVRVLALGIALVMLLSSCAFSKKGTDIGSVLNADAEFEKDYVVLSDADELTDLAGAEFRSQSGNLLYFVGEKTSKSTGESYDNHIVYNLETDTIVWESANSKKTDFTVGFGEVDEHPFFVVAEETYKLKDDERDISSKEETTTLYDCLGNEVASAEYPAAIETPVTAVSDIVYFEGKCYRADDSGKLTEAFDYSVLSAFPSGVDTKVNNKYFDIDREIDPGVKIYDDKLNFLKEYEIPSYASLLSVIFLKEDKLLIQYVYELDEDDKNFSFIFEGDNDGLFESVGYEFKSMTKYNLETVIYDIEKGKAKDVKCSYMLFDRFADARDEDEVKLLNEEQAQAIVWGCNIVDERLKGDIASISTLGINDKNKLFEIDEINGEVIVDINQVGKDKWEISTIGFKYMLTKGEIVGQVRADAMLNDDIYSYANRFFDMDLKQNYNCLENDMTVYGTLNGSFLLKNGEDEIFFYDGASEPDCFLDEDDIEDNYSCVRISNDMFVIIEATEKNPSCIVYNSEGYEIFDFDYNGTLPSVVTATENAVLVTYTDKDGEMSFYRFFK